VDPRAWKCYLAGAFLAPLWGFEMFVVIRLVFLILFIGCVSAAADDCQPCEDPSQIFCC
jgi:hypothetical protein